MTKKRQHAPLEEVPTIHWADHAAEELIRRHGSKSPLVCAAGISPSGMVHIGNFREVITVDFVVRALRDRGKDVRFIYSWDDYDALRKIPKNLPNAEMLEPHLRKPISSVPDPTGTAPSYSAHFEALFEKELKPLGINPAFIYQHEHYKACDYHKEIQHALKHEKEIRSILDSTRTTPLPEDWTCLTIFCKQCEKDTTKLAAYQAPSTVRYYCKTCKEELEIDFEKEAGVKLLWRVDWPMRWVKEQVDFEPGGKDHSSPGGSYETGAEITRKVWNCEPPYYVQYDFVLAKGVGAKLSSSTGMLTTLGEALSVYEPPVVRWLFASRKPNLDFSIAFDLDVMKAYDDFDRTERIALKLEPAEEKVFAYQRRIYQLSLPEAKGMPTPETTQFPFRHLCNILQIHQGNIGRAKDYFKETIKTPSDERRYCARAQCAWNWITQYAPEAFRFALRADDSIPPKTKYPKAIQELVEYLRAHTKADEDTLGQGIYNVMKSNGLKPGAFFPEVYSILIDKNSGPKLGSFISIIGPDHAANILEKALP